jgi:hypothetical protein
LPPQTGFPAPDAGQNKFNSRLVVPTLRDKEPFGENAEELFLFVANALRRLAVPLIRPKRQAKSAEQPVQ